MEAAERNRRGVFRPKLTKSQEEFKQEVRSWLKSMVPSGKSNQTYGEPEKWEFDYPWQVVQTAFWLWSMSSFQRLPIQDEVLQYDPRYISDLRLAHQIYSHQGNQSAPMKLFEQWEAYNQNPDGYKAGISDLVKRNQNDDSASPNQLYNRNRRGTPTRGRMVNTSSPNRKSGR